MIETAFLLAYFVHQVTESPRWDRIHRRDARRLEERRQVAPQRSSARGTLRVQAASPQPSTVPPGAQRVPMLRLTLEAGCGGDVIVFSIDVQRRGLGRHADIEGVYALSNGRRVSSVRTIAGSDGTVQINLRRLRIPACQRTELIVAADFAEDAAVAGEHRLILPETSAVQAEAADVRVTHQRASGVRRTGGGEPAGSVTAEMLGLNTSVRFGQNRTVGRFRITAQEEDQEIHAITFTNEGSAEGDDLRHLFVEGGGQRLSRITPQMDDERARIVFDPPLFIEEGDTRRLSLRADVHVGSSETLGFTIEETADVHAETIRGRRRMVPSR